MSNEAGVFKPFVRASTFNDCIELSKTMREEDKREIWHISRSSPLNSLIDGLLHSSKCWTVEWKGSVVAMFGVVRHDDVVGVPWMLASEDLKKIKKSFLRECHQYVERMFDGFQVLTNCAWSQNTIHIQWLKWLGFKFLPARVKGYDGELFYEFYKVK
jgi:hypothetical protein